MCSYPLLCLSSVAQKIHLRGILSDLTLSNEPLRWSCDVAGFPLLLLPAGYSSGGRAVWFAARVMQWRHQTKTQQDGRHLLLAYWPLIGNNKHSLNTSSLRLKDSNSLPSQGTAKCTLTGDVQVNKGTQFVGSTCTQDVCTHKQNVCWRSTVCLAENNSQ